MHALHIGVSRTSLDMVQRGIDMKFSQNNAIFTTAFALFAMLFGSGNIAFPLGLGRDLGSMAVYAMFGFFLTAVLVPVVGIIAMALCNGNYRTFFQERLGQIPAACVIFLCFALIGPVGIIPRCIAFSYLALQWLIPQLTLFTFTIVTAAIIFVATVSKSGAMALMGRVLGPIKLGLLSAVIIKGLLTAPKVSVCALPGWNTFVKGFLSGFGTFDLFGVIFSSGLLLSAIALDGRGQRRPSADLMRILVKGGVLAALLLGALYSGFVMVASMQSGAALCAGVEPSQLLSVLAAIILGGGGGVLASVTMAIACATTAIGLTSMFAEYMSTELPYHMLSYSQAVAITIGIATFFANYGASGIQAFLGPIVEIMYPALILLVIMTILDKVFRITIGSWPFYGALLGGIIARIVL